jgi:hypothetical protein
VNFSVLSLFRGKRLPAQSKSSKLDNMGLISTSPSGIKPVDAFDRLPSTGAELYSKTYPTFKDACDAFIDYAIHQRYAFESPCRQTKTSFPPPVHQQPQFLRTEKSPWKLPRGAFPLVKIGAVFDSEMDQPLIEFHASRYEPMPEHGDFRTLAEMPIHLFAKYHDHPEGLSTFSVCYYPKTGKISG